MKTFEINNLRVTSRNRDTMIYDGDEFIGPMDIVNLLLGFSVKLIILLRCCHQIGKISLCI